MSNAITAYDAAGQAVPTQLTKGWDGKRRVLFRAKVPAVGAAVYSLREGVPPVPAKVARLKVGSRSLENNRYLVKIDDNGDIASVFDKQIGKELLERPAQLEFVPNFPDRKPAWRIYPEDIMKAGSQCGCKSCSYSRGGERTRSAWPSRCFGRMKTRRSPNGSAFMPERIEIGWKWQTTSTGEAAEPVQGGLSP